MIQPARVSRVLGGKPWLVTAAVTCVIAVTACASSSRPDSAAGTDTSTLSSSLLKYAVCMRSHGVSGFPDPSTNQGPNSFGIDGYNFNLPANVSLQSPAYESASKACGHLIAGNGGGPSQNPAFMAKAKSAALAHAVCMRQHGVPNFPDPTFSSEGGGIAVSSGGPGLDPRSPAFQQAQKICQPH
jgi:hypothetical protein